MSVQKTFQITPSSESLQMSSVSIEVFGEPCNAPPFNGLVFALD